MAAYHRFMTRVTCWLPAKNRNQLRNPTLGNRVRATFYRWTFEHVHNSGLLQYWEPEAASLLAMASTVENIDRRNLGTFK